MNHTKLRDPLGWNLGFIKAFAVPDGPFKLYVWLRLNARIDTGTLEISQSDIARALKKSRGTIRNNLNALEDAGICSTKFSRNPEGRGWIQITDDYWPYERAQQYQRDDPELRSYLDRVRAIAEERACIRTPLSTTDDLLARDWYKQGITLEHIAQAVLMGCGRKYVSWRNGAPRPSGAWPIFRRSWKKCGSRRLRPSTGNIRVAGSSVSRNSGSAERIPIDSPDPGRLKRQRPSRKRDLEAINLHAGVIDRIGGALVPEGIAPAYLVNF